MWSFKTKAEKTLQVGLNVTIVDMEKGNRAQRSMPGRL
jgi:hypothetical protein